MSDQGVYTIKVTLKRLHCVAVGPDPGSALELYGKLGYRREPGAENYIWECESNEYVRIEQDESEDLNLDKGFQVLASELPIRVYVGGHLWEQDDNADDDMGDHWDFRTVDEYNLPVHENVKISFDEGGQKASAYFDITLVR